MESHPVQSRVGPFAWLFLQAASVVASILLAFAIDAWWDQRVENNEKNTMLRQIKAELVETREWLERERAYRIAARESAKALLTAISAGRYEDTEKTLDHRLSDLLWYSGTGAQSGMLEGLLQSGGLAAIEDETLRRKLAAFPGDFGEFSEASRQDYVTFTEVLTPFMARNASLPQISNEGFTHGRPGDGWGADSEGIVPVGSIVDHSALLGNQEFAGAVIRKLWNDSSVLYNIDDYGKAMDELVRLIDLELERTS